MTAAWIFVAWILLDVLICAAWILWRDYEKRMAGELE